MINLVAGFIAGQITKGHGFGLVVNMVIGIIGGILGRAILGLLGIAAYGLIGSLITAIIGAIVLLWIVTMLFGHKTE